MKKTGDTSSGFTIVETLIVLAVTGFLFVAAALLISGKQSRTEFMTGLQTAQQQVQQVINETASGYYPNTDSFSCTAGTPPSLKNTPPNTQGANYGCIFMGKIMQFQLQNLQANQYKVLSLTGNQRDSSGQEVASLSTALPQVIEGGTVSNPGFSGITLGGSFDGALTVGKVSYIPAAGGSPLTINSFGFLSSLASYSGGSSPTIISGSQQLSLFAIKNSVSRSTVPTLVDYIDSNYRHFDQASEVDVCLLGGDQQSGMMTIGGNGGQLTVTMKTETGSTCP